VVVTRGGDLVDGNRAFRELAERCGVMALPAEVFGAAFVRSLARAWIERHLEPEIPVVAGPEPRPVYRMTFITTPGDKTIGVAMRERTADLSIRQGLDAVQAELAVRNRQLEVLRDVGMALSGELDIESLTERIYEETHRVLPSRNVYIALWDRDQNQVWFPRYLEEGEWQEEQTRPLGDGLTEHLLRTGLPLLLHGDVFEQCRSMGIQPHGRACRSWVGVPMVADGEPIGVIALQDYERDDAFTDAEVQLLVILATLAASAIRNARSLGKARRAYRDLTEAQAQLLETERLRGVTETVGALNHEINNPLAAIAGHAQLLLRRRKTLDSTAVQKIESILDATKRIQRVVTKMASLIQATTMPYPGQQRILDIRQSLARDDDDDIRRTSSGR
jgi:GAF domain-containing protein